MNTNRELGNESGGPTILIVDDDPRNIELLELVLKNDGYTTVSAESGPEGRALARERMPSLILLDVMMEGEDGFETCAKLKQDSLTTDIPVIFISSMGDVHNKIKGLDSGAIDYITKPFDKGEILARTRTHLKLSYTYQTIIEDQRTRLKGIQDAQQSILVSPEVFPRAKFGVTYIPVLEAGGDFYDVFPISQGLFGYFVADISGHDLIASMATSALKVLVTHNAQIVYTPTETMKLINSVLLEFMKDGTHLTACYVHLNRIRSKMTVISAGHPPLIHLREGVAECVRLTGDILGVFNAVRFEPAELSVSESDRFFLYTDGLVERAFPVKKCRDEGIRELMDACVRTRDFPIGDAVPRIVQDLTPEEGGFQDDVVLLGVEV